MRQQLQRLGRAGRLRLRACQPGHSDPRKRQLVFVSRRQWLQGLDALVRPHAHELLLHRRRAVHERQVHPELEQRKLLGLLGNPRHSRLPRLRTHCDDWELPHLHRVQLQHDVLVSDLLLHVRLGVRQRPLHP
jgi:hypothetical protein